MAGWAGFSDDELRRLHQKDEAAVPAALGRGRRPAPTNRSRQQLQRERALHLAAQSKSKPESPALPADQQLSKPPPQAVSQPAILATPVEQPKVEIPVVKHDPAPAQDTPPIAKELEKQEVELREKTRLELLQQDQKMIEERNKRKKALLTKTIAEKSKQTQAEAVKLKRIQKELQALDDMVSNDIGILRGVIEQASWDYNNARKRYEKAEAEYVTSKLDLHRKTEVKEQLTEHLCAIIQQNELRKAHKLEELLQQLHLQATEEEQEEERKRVEEEEEERKRVEGEMERKRVEEEEEEGEKKRTSGTENQGEGKVQEDGESSVQSAPDKVSTAVS